MTGIRTIACLAMTHLDARSSNLEVVSGLCSFKKNSHVAINYSTSNVWHFVWHCIDDSRIMKGIKMDLQNQTITQLVNQFLAFRFWYNKRMIAVWLRLLILAWKENQLHRGETFGWSRSMNKITICLETFEIKIIEQLPNGKFMCELSHLL